MHLTFSERHYISIALKKGSSQTDIANELDRCQSVISRELKRNSGSYRYCHKVADNKALKRHQHKNKAIKLTDQMTEKITIDLRKDWSPEQITGRMKQQKNASVSHQTIYAYIKKDKQNGGDLHQHLRCKKKYRKRGSIKSSTSKIPNRVDIDKRPKSANNCTRIGHFEADTVMGKNNRGAILTLDERITKLRLAMPLPNKQALGTAHGIIEVLKPIKKLVKSITFDNGTEFASHEKVASKIGCKTYFARPYHSWERGQNENANGLLRQYFPKGSELDKVNKSEVLTAVHKLNNRPKKCLGFKTPYEEFKKRTRIDVKKLIDYAFMT